ncbi:alpha/beta hydrolase-fold protein [Ruminiclostridium papyrosolvens]
MKKKKKIPLIWWLSGLTCTDDNFSTKKWISTFG